MSERRTLGEMFWDFVDWFAPPPEVSVRPAGRECIDGWRCLGCGSADGRCTARRDVERAWDEGYKAALSYLVECQELTFGHRDTEPELPVNPYREDL